MNGNLLLNKELNIDALNFFFLHSKGVTEFTSGQNLFFCLEIHFNVFGFFFFLLAIKRHNLGFCLKWGSEVDCRKLHSKIEVCTPWG